MKRSNAPIFWALFGAGGMLAALIGPMLVFITGFAAPMALLLPDDILSYTNMQRFFQHGLVKGFWFVAISLFLWHSAHRVFHSLHDLGIHAGLTAKLICYGIAFAGTLTSAISLWRIGVQ